jgi:hypothetical protein
MSNSRTLFRRDVAQSLWPALLLLLCLVWAGGAAAAEDEASQVEVRSATLTLDQDVYELDAKVQISLPEDARKAIEAGLTLRFQYEIELSRVRRFMPDATVASLVQRYELNYHALSQRYLLRNLNTGEQQDFGTLQTALERLGDIRGLPVIDAALVAPGPQYEVGLRGVLDMGTAPDALKWILFWTDDWSTTSEWYRWPLRP